VTVSRKKRRIRIPPSLNDPSTRCSQRSAHERLHGRIVAASATPDHYLNGWSCARPGELLERTAVRRMTLPPNLCGARPYLFASESSPPPPRPAVANLVPIRPKTALRSHLV